MTKARSHRRWRHMTIGIIGTGHMGGMLARAFAKTSGETVYVYNRSRAKAEAVAANCPQIVICDTLQQIAALSDVVVVCTKAVDGERVAEQLGPYLTAEQLLLTTISTVDLARWQRLTTATPIKIVPSLTQSVQKGVVLITYPDNVERAVAQAVERRLARIGQPYVVRDTDVRVCSDLTSCGPAFLAFLCQTWAMAASRVSGIPYAETQSLVTNTLIGLAAMLEQGMDFGRVLEQICVPGGVTEAGLEALAGAEEMFVKLHEVTARHAHPSRSITPLPARDAR
ncbi:pyrroline-5-carboxylate reductase dimerization domain-containing protein [Alicyclobacillus hesperidum]|uniref:pyrroline-5-carboxylate reductase dimerization domain-containing protein n=1 Tax=Alicyclobacillus hesperidum TaxID=89784 RepID=UPI0024917FA4|nr:pyrroline-5-carboxylate reductase dimerization domain-containing protein [Alicyclobacillus hesperidum]